VCAPQVSAPQLSLLEAALARMERVDAFLMLRAHRSPGNVFEEARIAWQKRQATIAHMRREQAFAAAGGGGGGGDGGGASGWVSFWSQHVEVKGSGRPGGGGSARPGSPADAGGGDAQSALRDPAARRVAELASAASRVLRRWQQYQRLVRPPKALTDGSRVAVRARAHRE
jgi:hypothetical protein